LEKRKNTSLGIEDGMIKNTSHEKATQKPAKNPQKSTNFGPEPKISREKWGEGGI
jgi:hypothetical protein